MSDSFSRSIVISMAAHVALALAMLLRAVFIPSDVMDLRQAIRVDVVGLPDKVQTLPDKPPEEKAEAPAPAPEPVAKPEPVKAKPPKPEAPKVDLAKKKVDKKQALDRIKAMTALDKIKEEVGQAKTQKAKPVKGNIVSAGNSLSGLERIDYDRYFGEIEVRVRQHWSLPQWLIEARLRAQALVLIDETGVVRDRKIVKSSGNSEFDQRVLETIDRASPFPAPPERLRDALSVKGIIFNFPQRGTDT